jgi:glutathione peroxidase
MNNNLWQVDLNSTTRGVFNTYQFWDKPIVIFNSASLCGFTHQLAEFEELHQENKIIPIAIPTNNFGEQEPGDILEINQYYQKRFNVTYPIVDKTDLDHDFFKIFGRPAWNFNKWLFDKKHNFIMKFESETKPMDLLQHV